MDVNGRCKLNFDILLGDDILMKDDPKYFSVVCEKFETITGSNIFFYRFFSEVSELYVKFDIVSFEYSW